eukprot:183888-Rhodomonas_salina.2
MSAQTQQTQHEAMTKMEIQACHKRPPTLLIDSTPHKFLLTPRHLATPRSPVSSLRAPPNTKSRSPNPAMAVCPLGVGMPVSSVQVVVGGSKTKNWFSPSA